MKDILILGGGSAGWMTAAYLSKNNKDLNVTVIESKNILPHSVGESTTPYLMKFFESIGVTDEKDWMPKCNATYKNGVLYDDWDFINSRGWHSFEVDEDKFDYWNKKRVKEGLDRQDYWASAMYNSHIALRDSAKWLADKEGKIKIPYYQSDSYNGWPQHWAYHINADMFGNYVKDFAIDFGVNHIVTDISEVNYDNEGITSLIDDNGVEYTSDMYIDCTGFKRLLISKVAEEEFNSFEPYLTHDKAVVIRYPYTDPDSEMKPRTKSKCLSSGWYWEIPLYDKISVGYVYTSKFISDEDAILELRNEIGFEKTKDSKPFVVDINAGYYPKPWSKNVVAVGLSAGFIEPLEGTLLFAVQMAGINIDKALKGDFLKEDYNNFTSAGLGDFIDFISIGYYMSHRTDSAFWRSKGKNTPISDRMKRWLEDGGDAPEDTILFVKSSWLTKQIIFNNFPETVEDPKDMSKEISNIKNFDTSKLISQKEYLDRFIYKEN